MTISPQIGRRHDRSSAIPPRHARQGATKGTHHEQEKHKDKHGIGGHAATGRGPSTPDASASSARPTSISREDYRAQLHLLQIELVKLQRHFVDCEDKILVLLKGRDAAGKDGIIKRIVKYLSPRDTRVVALGKPSDRERGSWYFQRYVAQLPIPEELVHFNRSWYNPAGVEHVMGFCSKDEHKEFMQSVPKFDEMLVHSGIKLLKYYLDIGKSEQTQRLAERKRDPLKQWKSSPFDAVALKHWKAYSEARDAMLLRTHTAFAPWHVVHTGVRCLVVVVAQMGLLISAGAAFAATGKV